jgi:hypothetical protein
MSLFSAVFGTNAVVVESRSQLTELCESESTLCFPPNFKLIAESETANGYWCFGQECFREAADVINIQFLFVKYYFVFTGFRSCQILCLFSIKNGLYF